MVTMQAQPPQTAAPVTPMTLTKQDSRSRDAAFEELPACSRAPFAGAPLSLLSLEQCDLSTSVPNTPTCASSTQVFAPVAPAAARSAAADVLSVVPADKLQVLEARMTKDKDSKAVLKSTVVGFGAEGSSKDGITTGGEPYRYTPGGPASPDGIRGRVLIVSKPTVPSAAAPASEQPTDPRHGEVGEGGRGWSEGQRPAAARPRGEEAAAAGATAQAEARATETGEFSETELESSDGETSQVMSVFGIGPLLDAH